jgi:hypothetical protein
MRRFLVLALLSVVALIAFAAIPAIPPHSPLAGFSSSAQAATAEHVEIYWFGYAAVLMTLVAAVFIGILLWRREHVSTSAYWSFAILLGFPA